MDIIIISSLTYHRQRTILSTALLVVLSFYLPHAADATNKGATNPQQQSKPKRNLLDIVLENYDLDKWPTFHEDDGDGNVTGEPTVNTVWVDVMFISSINVEAMDLTIDMYLNQKWNDKRLKFSKSVSRRRLHLKTVDQMRRIWSPDTYIVNAKQANFHHITTENRVVYISGNGDVFYSARITAKIACEMKFHSFPMDNQECMLHLASYAYTVDILQMIWLPEGPVSYKQDMDLNQFHLTNVSTSVTCVDMYPDGGFPCLKIYFKFERRVAHHLIQTFLPTVLIVTISWVSFYIQADAVPARISLGITTLLTMITLNSGTKQGLPPVSYVKAIDVWMGVCTFFVFSAIWEYVVVCILVRRPLGCQRHSPYHHPSNLPRHSSLLTARGGGSGGGGASQNHLEHSPNRFLRSSVTSSLIIPNVHAQDCGTDEGVAMEHLTSFSRHTEMANSNIDRAAAYGTARARLASLRQPEKETGKEKEYGSSNNNHHSASLKHLHHLKEIEMQMRSHHERAASTPNASDHARGGDQGEGGGRGLKVVWEPRTISCPGLETGEEQEFHLQTSPSAEQLVSRKKKKIKIQCICTSQARSAQERSKRVDIIARVAYPFMFLFFNLLYWPYYLYWSVAEPTFSNSM